MRIQLGTPLMLSEIACAVSGTLNTADAVITHISTDTRALWQKDLFIAIGEGAAYIAEAKRIGAYTLSGNINSDIFLENTENALLDLASLYIKKLPYLLYNVGITGSVGKTTTKEFLKIILSDRFRTHANDGNHNNHIGLPLSILKAPRDTQVLVMEMGMNHEGEIERLSKCFRPDIAVITNIGRSHIGNLGSREKIAKAKLEILCGMSEGHLFVPHEEPLLVNTPGRITVSTGSLNADYTLLKSENYVSLFSGQSQIFEGKFNLSGEHNLSNLAFSCSVGAFLGLTDLELADRTSLISQDNTRQSVIHRKNYSFVSDCYNSSPESIVALVNLAKKYKEKTPKSLLLGDVLELGDYTESIHEEIGREISHECFENLFLFGKHVEYVKTGAISNGFPSSNIFTNYNIDDPQATAEQIKSMCQPGTTIFMKASRGLRLERILNYFEQEG